MNPPDTPSSEPPSSSRDASQRFAAVRMPIEEPVADFADAVQKLQQCDSADLRRARQHHRRALESLQNGGYSGLSDATRKRLVGRLRANLKALNHVLDASGSADAPSSDEEGESDGEEERRTESISSHFRTLFQALW
jgi:hypothetical protein